MGKIGALGRSSPNPQLRGRAELQRQTPTELTEKAVRQHRL